jgi:carboxyl-terminal processing protease
MRLKSLLSKNRRGQVFIGAGVVVVTSVFWLGMLTGEGRIRFWPMDEQYSGVTGLPSTLDYSSVTQLYNLIRQNYDGKLTTAQILNGIKHGLADAPNDPYTEYFSPSEAQAFNGELQGQSISGIGAELDQDAQGDIVVMSPLQGQPAAKAGIEAKDIISSINGQSTTGMTVDDAVDKIRGKEGSKVTLGIVRGGQQLIFTITRETIQVPTATWKVVDGDIGYLQVSQFSDDTFGLTQQAVTAFQKAGVKKVILDLRDDPGGEVTTAQNIASLWLPADATIEQEKRGNTVIADVQATGNNPLRGMPTVVLVDGGSASASEITALALRDNKVATIIGEQSYGKGVVQSVIPFSDGSELKVTIAKWYGPNNENINHVGIKPNQVVQLTSAEAEAGNDTQLNAAITYLQSVQ